jgi:hypothetical protein
MQIITACRLTPEHYQSEDYHLRLRPPPVCPICHGWRCLKPYAIYERWTTGKDGKEIRITIPRFLCRKSERTVSLLPEFAQPYRLVANRTIQAYFAGRLKDIAVERLLPILVRYRRRWECWYKKIGEITGAYFGLAPPGESASALWKRALASCGTLTELTKLLVESFQVTCFGRYRCHASGCAK